jgi:crotonobetainyl-CoA:carnitine CoA-transferase CaiB-like acyl-CoA transferase
MLAGLLGMAALQTSEYFGTGKAPKRLGSAHPRAAPYQGFQASDAPFMIAAGNDKLWLSVCDVGRAAGTEKRRALRDRRVARANQKALEAILQREFSKRPKPNGSPSSTGTACRARRSTTTPKCSMTRRCAPRASSAT